MPSSESIRFDIVDHVMLIVHANVAPTDADWTRLNVVRNANLARIRGNLVVAPPRASINSSQRADVAKYMKDTGASLAVVTDSSLIRGVARAVSLLGFKVRAFSHSELPSALDYLVLAPARHAEIIHRISAMQAQLAESARSTSP